MGGIADFHGFEVPGILQEAETGKEYRYRKIFVLSSQLKDIEEKGLEEKLKKALDEIGKMVTRLNRYKSLDSVEKIQASLEATFSRYGVKGLIDYNIDESIHTTKKKVGRGKVGSNSVHEEMEIKEHKLQCSKNMQAIKDAMKLCGYFVLATNKPEEELPMAKALASYKQEWMVERVFERLKGPLQVIPIYLKLPEHIEAMMYLFYTFGDSRRTFYK